MKQLLCSVVIILLALGSQATLAGPAVDVQLINDNGGYGVSSQAEWLAVGEPVVCVAHVYRLDYDTMLYGDGNGNAGEVFQDVIAGNFACPSIQNRGFGEVVSIDGDLMAVGAPFAKGPKSVILYGDTSNDDGTVFVFQFDGAQWVEITQTLEALDAGGLPTNIESAEYGHAVSVSGDLIAVGARGDNSPATGAVYLYRFDPDTVVAEQADQIAKINGENEGDEFGSALSIWQQQVMVGVPGYDLPAITPIENAGAAYLYELDGDVPALIDVILIDDSFGFEYLPQAVGTEVSVGENLGLLAGQSSYPMQRIGGTIVPRFQYARTNGGDVSRSDDVAAFGISGEGVDVYPDVLNDNADQQSNYHLQITLNGGVASPGLAKDIRIYKDLVAVNDNFNDRVQSLFFPCAYGGQLRAFEWKAVSVPCELPPGTTVEQAFNADIFPGLCPVGEECGVLGAYGDNNGWIVWEQIDDYTSQQPTQPMAATDEVVNGKGYWIITDAAVKDPGQPVYWNVDDSTSTQRTLFDTGDVPGLTRPDNVAGYKVIPLDPAASAGTSTHVLLGNPFSRSFHWPNVAVSLDTLFGTNTVLVESANAFAPFFSITGYIQKPEYDEANPYIAMTTTPGLDSETEVPVNTGFWIVINQFLFSTQVNSLLVPFEK